MFAKITTKFKMKKLFRCCFAEIHEGSAELHKVLKKIFASDAQGFCNSLCISVKQLRNKNKKTETAPKPFPFLSLKIEIQQIIIYLV